MQLLNCFTSVILVFVLRFGNGSYGARLLDHSICNHETVMKTTPDANKMIGTSTNDASFLFEAHLTFSNQHEGTIMTPQEEAFLNSTMIVAFEQSKIKATTSDDVDGDMRMIHAHIVSTTAVYKNKKHFSKDIRRSVRYSTQRNRYYRIYDYSILLEFGCGTLCGDKSGFWDRRRFLAIAHSRFANQFAAIFESNVCNVLRASSYEILKTVTNCRLRFAS